jgi:hypothetical protein
MSALRGQSGKHILALSFSDFDPSPTSLALRLPLPAFHSLLPYCNIASILLQLPYLHSKRQILAVTCKKLR